MKKEQVTSLAVFCGLVALAVSVRLISETPNFNAVTAAALFAGFYFQRRLTAVCVPLAAMTISDMFLGGYDKYVMAAVYGSLLVPIAWRSMLRSGLTPSRVGLGAVSSSVAFYVLTNGAVWYAWYPHTTDALARCYTIALPFFANSLASDALFAAGLFGLYALSRAVGGSTLAGKAIEGQRQISLAGASG
ncbi:MAG TPA: DUF6580 family putative transport protein [Pirellulales bacterium]|nr:DUF6580 family putative transport protein [Pirellulales bacterium]